MEFLIAEDGYPALDIDHRRHVLADFLRGDVQADISCTNEHIALCELVGSGQLPEWEGTGSAYTVTIKLDCVEIFNEYTEESLIISNINEFKSYLEQWKELILSRN
ncbi:hypothetical protein FE394_03985 [Xenorhabdus sp. Reich]|uniref:Uncharacterized protein n=1 Tax=Xenorhabdus littoralis TaxID=2582835 RepID=A0ABU4SI91_9GAMM|nr:hypothetical protein [Xenorhabdus sp. Reich]MDX7998377.1 hypothetical protein [Xenorhabdus sp. Reich]